MGVYIRGMEMPVDCHDCELPYVLPNCPCYEKTFVEYWNDKSISLCRHPRCPLVSVPPHGDLIDRDALIKDGWLNLHKEVIRMGGYAIYELPLKNPSIPVIIPAEEE